MCLQSLEKTTLPQQLGPRGVCIYITTRRSRFSADSRRTGCYWTGHAKWWASGCESFKGYLRPYFVTAEINIGGQLRFRRPITALRRIFWPMGSLTIHLQCTENDALARYAP